VSHAQTSDGFSLYYEETGDGHPVVFVHEFAGDYRAWEPQVRHFSRNYRCITFNARGYPPSDVPPTSEPYSQERAVEDLKDVLDAVGADAAHIVGSSMGAFCTLHFGLKYPDRVTSMVVAGCGYGSQPDVRPRFQAESERIAESFETDGSRATASWYGFGPSRIQLKNKDPRSHAEHVEQLASHDPLGASLTMRNVQKHRPSLYEMTDSLAQLRVPALILSGDEDEGALDASLMLKRTVPSAWLAVLPNTGHLANLEEPHLFNELCSQLFARVDSGRWTPRDPKSVGNTLTGA
jgi:pimeloyl-ACP methyl ester carboxylesterase